MTARITAIALFAAALLAAGAARAQREEPTPPSPENIKAQCWMKYESQRKLTLDKKLELVEKCISERSRGQR